MFDIGFFELMLIGIVGLIVIGPERLPRVARTLGKWVGRTRRFISNVKQDIDREIRQDEIRQALQRNASLDEIKNIINDSRFTIEDEVEGKRDYVVKARDDDPRAAQSQQDLLKEQEKDFDNEDYGLTDHRDYGADEFPAVEPSHETADKQTDKPAKKPRHDGQDNKSGG